MADAFSVISSALPSTTRVLAFRGTEAISAPYELQIHLWIEDPAFDMGAAIGADMTLSIHREDGQPCVFHGVLATIETVDDLERGSVYRTSLVPRLWQLSLTQHSRVFVGQTAPAIIEETLKAAGMTSADYELKLTGTYSPLEHVCQYRESNLAFLSRRMEREGIYYFFVQGESRERLVVTDDKSFHPPFAAAPVRYHRVAGAGAGSVEGLRSFTCKHTTLPGSVVVKDHDYLRPALDVSGRWAVSDRGEELHLHGENFVTPEEGQRLARIRGEELKARQTVFRGVGNTPLLRPGHSFALQEHPRQGVDGEYLTTELVHTGHHLGGVAGVKALLGLEEEPDEVYRVEVVAIPKGVQFRPGRRTPTPRIYGTERAVVDGPADSDYAQLDEHGRYLVKMHIDESPARDGKASARVRMMQPHGGSPESFHFPLRKGTEVLLSFEGGDPDRPVIAGVVPNLVNPTGVTSANATRNILQTGGRNRFQLEDREGKQHVRFSTPHLNSFLHLGAPNDGHNWIGNTDGNTYSITGQDSETGVGGSRLTVIGDAQGTYTKSDGSKVTGNEMDPLLLGEALALANPAANQGNIKGVTGGMDTVGSAAPVKAGTITVTETGSGTPTSTITVPAAPGAGGTAGDVTGSGGPSGVTIQFADSPGTSFSLNLTPPSTDAVPASGTNPGMIATGILQDPDTRTGYRPGSDIKILAGDNVTKGDHDNVSAYAGDQIAHVHGHSISFVGMGQGPNAWTAPAQAPQIDDTTLLPAQGTPIQQSTIYGGTISTVYAPSQLQPTSTLVVQPPTAVPTDGSEAQRSLVFGNQLSWVSGSTSTTVNGTQTTAVQQGSHSTITAPSPPANINAPTHDEPTTAQSTVILGDQYSYVDGTQNVTIEGRKYTEIFGEQHTTVHSDSYSTISGASISTAVHRFSATAVINAAADLFKFAAFLNQVTVGATKSSYSVFSTNQSVTRVDYAGAHVAAGDKVFASIMCLFV
jgi:type VI secretion system secreted protein VgrG